MVDVQKSDVQIAFDAVDIVGGSRDNWKRWISESGGLVRYYPTGKLRSEMYRLSMTRHRHFFGIAIDRSGRIAVECCECAESVQHAKSVGKILDLEGVIYDEPGCEPTCEFCGNAIDEGICWCGCDRESHGILEDGGHHFIPMGCTCWRSVNWSPIYW